MKPKKRTRVLCVDDEANILEGLKLHLGRNFDLSTAIGGKAALEMMESEGPFAVIVVDMRMPAMNGIEFLQAARQIASDTTFIMLTGNHELETAALAINEGHVFRFLNKPCPSNILKIAIDDGIERYNLLKEKREVLNDTFVGSIRLMTEILEMSHPAIFSRAHAVEQIAMQFIRRLGLEERWEYKLAVRLCRIGAALTVGEEENKISTDPPSRFQWEAEVGSHLVGLVPRLRMVAQIVAAWADASGSFPAIIATDEEVIQAGSALCRASWFLDEMYRGGHTAASAAKELSNFMPLCSDRMLEAAKTIEPPAFNLPSGASSKSTPIPMLKEGMTVAKDFVDPKGTLVEAGRRLSRAMIYRLTASCANTPDLAIEVLPG